MLYASRGVLYASQGRCSYVKEVYVSHTIFPKARRLLGLSHFLGVFFLGLFDKTDVTQSGLRRVPFLKSHLVTVTDSRPTFRFDSKLYDL